MANSGPDFSALVAREFGAFGLLSEEGSPLVARAVTFVERAVTWNARIDLTSVSDPGELVDLLFADAAAIVASGLVAREERWVDVGSGIGAPGLGLGLLRPDLDMTLLEPRAKRVAFLRTTLASLAPLSVRVERARSESLAAASFDVAISRATLPPPEWLAEGARIARRGVWVLMARGALPAREGWSLVREVAFRWPLCGKERRAALYAPLVPS